MTKRLIAPKLTEGEWKCDVSDQGSVGGNAYVCIDAPEVRQTVARVICYDELRNLERLPYEANARFLAGSKKTSEALARIIEANDEFRRALPAGWEGDPVDDACKEARAALVAQGYSYSEQE
jgi:hypothetical protein